MERRLLSNILEREGGWEHTREGAGDERKKRERGELAAEREKRL